MPVRGEEDSVRPRAKEIRRDRDFGAFPSLSDREAFFAEEDVDEPGHEYSHVRPIVTQAEGPVRREIRREPDSLLRRFTGGRITHDRQVQT